MVLRRLKAADEKYSKRFFLSHGGQRTHRGRGRSVLKGLERLGQGYLWFGLPLLVLLRSEDEAWRRDALTLLAAMALDLICVAALKATLRRPRPPYMVQDMLIISVDKFSFPSGHASRCALLACLAMSCSRLRGARGLEAALASVVTLWALSTAASRVALGRHYLADVLTGLMLGVCEYLLLNALHVPALDLCRL